MLVLATELDQRGHHRVLEPGRVDREPECHELPRVRRLHTAVVDLVGQQRVAGLLVVDRGHVRLQGQQVELSDLVYLRNEGPYQGQKDVGVRNAQIFERLHSLPRSQRLRVVLAEPRALAAVELRRQLRRLDQVVLARHLHAPVRGGLE
eukprot:3749779-Pyramimonas_sp.AAC.1